MEEVGQLDNRKNRVLEALEECNGIVTVACKRAGMPRSTFYHYLETDDLFKKMVDELQDVALDFVESKLFEKINGVLADTGKSNEEGEPVIYKMPPSDTAIIFYLKTKGKKRGYIERNEVTGKDGDALFGKITWNDANNGQSIP